GCGQCGAPKSGRGGAGSRVCRGGVARLTLSTRLLAASWNLSMRALRNRLLSGMAALLLAASPTLAQSFPSRPITIVVPFPPGPLDVVARWIAPKMSEAFGQPVVVDHRPGANGALRA